MDRKRALKEMKKQKNNYNTEEENSFISRFVMTIGVVLLALILLYLFIGIFVTKTISFNKDNEEVTNNTSIDQTTILASQIFDQNESEYYVLVYDPEDEVHDLNAFLSIYQNKGDSLKVYKVDSTKKFNSKYIVKSNSNKNPINYSELKIISPTLIKISSRNVSEYIEGFEEVKNMFKK